MAGGCVRCPQCKTLLLVPAPNIFLRCGVCSMLMSIGANGSQQEVKSVIFEDNVNRPSSAESQSPPQTPVPLLGPGPIPPRHYAASPSQAIPQNPGFAPPQQVPLPAAIAVHQPLQTQVLNPQIASPGVPSFIAQGGLAPQKTFTPAGALPLAQPASWSGAEETRPAPVKVRIPLNRLNLPAEAPQGTQLEEPVLPVPGISATHTPSSSEGDAVAVSTTPNGSPEGLPQEQTSAEEREHPAEETSDTGLSKETPLSRRSDEREGGLESGTQGHPFSAFKQPPVSANEHEASSAQASVPEEHGQSETSTAPLVRADPPSGVSESVSSRPKSAYGSRSPPVNPAPEQTPREAPEPTSEVPVASLPDPATHPLRTISLSRPPPPAQPTPELQHPRSPQGIPGQPSLARQPSHAMAHPGGAALTFTCASCNNAQMLPALPPGVHNMRCGTCGSVNEVQIAAPPAAAPPPAVAVYPPQAYAGQQTVMQGGGYGQQPVSSPGSQGGGYGTPPSPPAQNVRCGACGTLMILPPLEPGVHQMQCGGCRAIVSVPIQAPEVQPPPQLTPYPSGHYNGPGRAGAGSSLKDKLKKNFKKHMEFQKSGGNAAALFHRPGSADPQQWAPPQAQPGYQPAPQQGYQQGHPQGYLQPSPQEYQQTSLQGYQQISPQGYQQTAPQQPAAQVYQHTSPQGYQQTTQPGYLQAAQVVSPQSPQPPVPFGYEQTSQQGYQAHARPALEPTAQQTLQPAYSANSAYQPQAQPVSQPDYQYSLQPAQQQAVLQPSYSSENQLTRRPAAAQPVPVQSPPQGASRVSTPPAQMAHGPQAVVHQPQAAATPRPPPPDAGLDAYLEAQLKITTQSPPSSAGSARRPDSLPHSASNLSNQSADGRAAYALGPRASSESSGGGDVLRGVAQEQTAPPNVNPQAAYSSAAENPSARFSPDVPDKQTSPPARSPPLQAVPHSPPERVQTQAWGQEPLPSLAQPLPAAPVSPPPAFAPASGVPSRPVFQFERLTQPPPTSNPPQVYQVPPNVTAQSEPPYEANNFPPGGVTPYQPPPPQAFATQPAQITPPQRGLYSQSSDQSSLASYSSTGTGPVNTAPQQWQPDPLLAPAAIWVNGQRLTEELTSAAEVLAGPIERGGFYWYDRVAGFWGEYGKPCQGILPPGIPEFDFPLPPDAAGGTTGIYVNGRQLAARDLAMLRQRKFPQKERKRYTLDIGGTLKDEESGKVVVELGKLAQSVEESGVGKGMKKAQFAPPPPPVQTKPKGKGWGDLRTLLQK